MKSLPAVSIITVVSTLGVAMDGCSIMKEKEQTNIKQLRKEAKSRVGCATNKGNFDLNSTIKW